MLQLDNENMEFTQQDELYRTGYNILKVSAYFIEKILSLLPSKLIIITGVSCSGKTEISKGLLTEVTEVVHIDADVIARQSCMQLLMEINEKLFNQLYTALGEDLAYYALFYSSDDIFSKKNIVDNHHLAQNVGQLKKSLFEDQQILKELNRRITYVLLDKIQQYMLLGKIVILDLVATGESLKPFSKFSPLLIAIYKPIDQLTQRMQERNRKALEENKPINFRSPASVLPQVSTFFSSYDNFTHLPRLRSTIKADVLLNADGISIKNLVRMIHQFIVYEKTYKKLKSRSKYIVMDNQNITPQLIILDGLSTAGKTTTAEAYISLHSSTELLHRSERQRAILLNKIPSVLKNENPKGDAIFCYAKYKNNTGFNTLFNNKNRLRTGYIETIDRFCRNKQNEIFLLEEKDAAEKAKSLMQAGITVILDNLIFKDDLKEFRDLAPTVVLVYCPFENIINHLIRRVDESIKHDRPLKWRDPYNIYRSYTKLFGPKNIFASEECLEKLSREHVLTVLKKLFDNFQAAVYGIDVNTFSQEILSGLGLDKLDVVAIFPQLTKPDLVLNTKNPVHQNATILASYLNSKTSLVAPAMSI